MFQFAVVECDRVVAVFGKLPDAQLFFSRMHHLHKGCEFHLVHGQFTITCPPDIDLVTIDTSVEEAYRDSKL